MSQNEVTAFRILCRRRFTFVNRHQFPIFKKQKNLWSWQGSNLRPPECKSGALPTELQPLFMAVDQVGLRGLEPRTSSLSGMRSNHLSYKPINNRYAWPKGNEFDHILIIWGLLPRKEVIQPHLPVQLPCYDLALVTSLTFDGSLLKGWATGFGYCRLPWLDGRCVQDPGTYSPRRADARLLAIPAS